MKIIFIISSWPFRVFNYKCLTLLLIVFLLCFSRSTIKKCSFSAYLDPLPPLLPPFAPNYLRTLTINCCFEIKSKMTGTFFQFHGFYFTFWEILPKNYLFLLSFKMFWRSKLLFCSCKTNMCMYILPRRPRIC